MTATPISCPRCRKAFHAATPVAQGSSVRCRECGTLFKVSASTPVTRRTPTPVRKPPAEETAPAAPQGVKSLTRHPLLVPALAGVLLIAGMGSALAVYMVATSRTNKQVVQGETSPEPPAPERPIPPVAEKPGTPPEIEPRRDPELPEEVPLPRVVAEAEEVELVPRPVLVLNDTPKEPPHRLDTPPDPKKPEPPKPPAVKLRPLSRNVLAGLDRLVKWQNADGSWGGADLFGGVFPMPAQPGQMNRGDVANTSIAALAILRAGYSPRSGWSSANLRKAVEFICTQVEKSDKDSLFITDLKGTQIQHKIGTYADTFLAALVLVEVKGKMADAKGEARVTAALEKIVDKMQRNQKDDGTWANEGWAPVLSQALASKALNRARQVGIAVKDEVLEKTARHAKENFEKHFRNFKEGNQMGFGAAGVALYAVAAYIGALHDAVQTHRQRGDGARAILSSPNLTEQERKEAQAQLLQLREWEKILSEALDTIAKKLADEQFVRGFGSDGGEEYLSYMILTETLHTKKSKELPKWDKLMTDRLQLAQNADASWAGQHCITGRAFCSSAALLTLLADRAAISRK